MNAPSSCQPYSIKKTHMETTKQTEVTSVSFPGKRVTSDPQFSAGRGRFALFVFRLIFQASSFYFRV